MSAENEGSRPGSVDKNARASEKARITLVQQILERTEVVATELDLRLGTSLIQRECESPQRPSE